MSDLNNISYSGFGEGSKLLRRRSRKEKRFQLYGIVAIFVASLFLLVLIVSMTCLLYTSPSPRDATLSRMPASA